jgi:uncharacterized protein
MQRKSPIQSIIGRVEEQETLARMYKSPKSEFVILYGRRRVGKTYLVNQFFEGKFTFRITAQAKIGTKKQLVNFYTQIVKTDPEPDRIEVPINWFDAFQMLIDLLERSNAGRKVVFLDELPWFDTKGSDFLSALEHFWNGWAANRNDVLLVACGSAASWMMNKLIHNRGGLHNRVTERIWLKPFNLYETEAFLKMKGANYDRYQLLELYMAMGGIPFYLDNILPNRSVAQNIDRMFFDPSGLLYTEYADLYASLFTKYEKHLAVVDALAAKSNGMLRAELLQQSGLPDGGSTSVILEELEQSGFIKRYFPFGKNKREALYRLIDPFTLFYQTFVKDSKAEGSGAWLTQANSPKWRAWSGYAYEFLCLYHADSIKKQLGIGSVYTELSAWRSQKSDKGAQIDLILDRNDRVINLCEIKFSTKPFTIDKAYAENLAHKVAVFREETGTNKTIFLTMITTYGVKGNQYSQQLVHDTLGMEALFNA